mmetsp:Transcript_110278/g.202164  ORF Transcript_110278/g.202164 Transcript_110278/m.202164 type:complete len:131 (+) Transcript_110278:2968-3360(+)
MCCGFPVDHKHTLHLEYKVACMSFSITPSRQQRVMHNIFRILNDDNIFFRDSPIAKRGSATHGIPRCHDNVEVSFHAVANQTNATNQIGRHIVVDFLADGAGSDERINCICHTHEEDLDYIATWHNIIGN